MNRHHHQLVFNRARGCLMAVGEGARRVAKAATGQGLRGGIAVATLLLCAAQAQIVADPGAPGAQRPTVLAAPNGTPLVNITTPSAAGVSRNTYRQFDVGAPGAILNNSRTDTATQLGGWVQGNPWLAGGSARVILNEVNSSDPSKLNGWVEVAGQRAEVVIANPAGIQVNGAGFINASAVTLTTGTPVFNGGALDAYRVQGGLVSIDGAGLDARGTDATAILARAVQLNAGLWAQRLNIVTGANTVAAGALARPTATATPNGSTPSYALDVAQIGGMYASHIHLIGTEAGLGVNNRGVIAAETGQLTLDTQGRLTNQGALLAAGDMALRADELLNEGTASAPAVIGAGDALSLDAGHVANRGTLEAGQLHVRADTFDNRSGGALFADRIAIEARELNNRPDVATPSMAPAIAARQDLQLGVHTLNNADGALIHSGGNMGIGGALSADANGALLASGQAEAVNNLSADIEALGDLRIAARTLTNERRNVHVTQATVVDQSAQLSMPTWWVNGKNEHGAPITNTSNYTPYQYYLLDPASILSEELLITPDGNTIRRVEVALDPRDSIHFAAAGAYGGQYGVQSRINVGTPTTAVLYVQARQDGVANPDQVAGSADVFAAHTSEVHTWQQDSLSYSNAYGRCSTACTLLVVQPGYSDPLSHMVRSDQAYLVPTHPGLEVSRTAHHTAVEDRLNADAGASAAIRSGAGMTLTIGESLLNRHADLQAGGALDIQASGAVVTNEGITLKRTHRFAITSQTAGLGEFDWTKPDITETLGELGGHITSNAQLSIQALDLSNTDHARPSGLASTGLNFVGVSLPGAGAPLVVAPSSLFQQTPPSAGYLLETDPRFTQHRSWLGSDYLLGQLAFDPSATHKRLGDGFYEQRLVREQLGELTGRHYLDGFASDEAQFLALMNAGLAYALAFNLKPGIALSAEQMAQLTTDLVWLVEREVVLPDGRKTTALVPQVCLRAVPGDALQPSGALIAGQDVRLHIERDLLNHGARLEGEVLVAQAGRDISNIGGVLQARSDLLVSAGRHVTIASPTHTTRFSSAHVQQSRTELAGVGTVRVTGDAPGAQLRIEAGHDIVLQGASVSNASPDGTTTLQAGHNLQLQTVTVGSANSVVADARNHRHSSDRQEIGSDIAALGDVHISAGQNVAARAASVQAGGDLRVQAGQDITLQAGRAQSQSESSLYLKRSGPVSKKSTEVRDSSASDVAIGSSFGGANVAMQAGRDIQLQGSEANAQDLLLLDAGRDVVIASEENQQSGSRFQETRKSGLSADVISGVSYGKNHQNTNQTFTAVTQAASHVSGGDVHIQSGRDAVVRSSTVLADQDITVVAGRDARIEAASDTTSTTVETHAKSTSIGITPSANGRFTAYGRVKAEQDGAATTHTAAQSLLSANSGSLTVIAGTDSAHKGSGSGNVATQGGTLLAQDTVTVSGNQVTLGTADSQGNSQFHAQTRTFTVGSQLSGVVGSAITSVGDMIEVARSTDNDRMKAAAALKAGFDAYKLSGTSAADLAADAEGGTAANPGDPNTAGIGVSVNVGSSKSRQDERQSSTEQAGTVIQAGGIHIQAREGDLSATGAKLQAQDINLQAEGDIHLQAARNTAELHSNNSGGSAGFGVTFGFGEQNGISFQVSASRAKGSGNGSETTHDNTVVTATNHLVLQSGSDTNLRGAQLAGDKVTADVGGSLNIQTLQDSSHYESEQKSSGVNVSVCVPPICFGNMVTGSASTAKERVDHHFQSANEQSGIAAGSAGFDITVNGNTDLQGAAITSGAAPDKNHLTTGSLTYGDLTNTQVTRAKSESMSVGYGGGSAVATMASNMAANALANELGDRGLPENITQTSTTQSVISPAKVTITGVDAESAENVATLTQRDASTANAALANQLTLQQAQELKAKQEEARQNQIAANYVGAVLTHGIGDIAKAQGWPDGSWQKTALHGLAGLIQAEVAGTDAAKAMTAAMLNEQLTPVLAEYLQAQGIDPRSPEFKALMTAGAALLGSAFDAANVTVTATVNNYLKHAELDQKQQQLAQCTTDACRADVKAHWDKVSQDRNAQMENSCLNGGADQCRANVAEMQRDLSDLQGAGGDFNKGLSGLTPEERNNIKQVMAQTRTNLEVMAELGNQQLGNQQLGTTYASPRELVAAGILTEQEGQLLEAARAGSMVNFLGAVVLPSGVKANAVRTAGNAGEPSTAKGITYDGVTGPGPLGAKVASTFRSGTYTELTTSETTTLYRVWGGKAGEIGPYWTRTPPSGPVQSVVDSALSPTWGNTAMNVTRIQVPPGVTVYEGIAAPQGGLVGGGNQVFIPKVDPAWIVK